MKKVKELSVDSIGGHDPLTKSEEKIISDFLKSRSTKKSGSTRGQKSGGRKSAA